MQLQSDIGRQWRIHSLLLTVAAFMSACAQQPTLVPAPDATVVGNGGLAAMANSADITIIARANSWRGEVDIEDAVTPMMISIENNSDRKLRIRYSDFGLVSEDGRHYAALPPYSVTGSVTEPVVVQSYPAFSGPDFYYRRFYIAPHYRSVYPGLRPYVTHRWYYDPYYYSFYYPYWNHVRVRIELPTAEMLRAAMPEGVLDEGGELRGFLYFQRVPRDLRGARINFHADIVDAVSGERFATLHIPFVADGNASM